MNKGYAFGFLIILLIVILGMYVAVTGFMSSRDARRTQPTLSSGVEPSQATLPPANPSSTATAAMVVVPTPLPGITATLTAAVLPAPTEPPPPAEPSVVPPAEPIQDPVQVQPTDRPTPLPPPPTPIPAPAFQFRLAGPPAPDPGYPNCCYIVGTVRDAAGNPLEGVQVQARNEWNTLPPAATKGGAEAGQYNIPLGFDAVSWDIVIVDAAGNQISTKTSFLFEPEAANAYRVDWRRTY